MGAKVILDPPEPLKIMIDNMNFSYIQINDAKKIKIDYYCSLASLPLAFNTTIRDNITAGTVRQIFYSMPCNTHIWDTMKDSIYGNISGLYSEQSEDGEILIIHSKGSEIIYMIKMKCRLLSYIKYYILKLQLYILQQPILLRALLTLCYLLVYHVKKKLNVLELSLIHISAPTRPY